MKGLLGKKKSTDPVVEPPNAAPAKTHVTIGHVVGLQTVIDDLTRRIVSLEVGQKKTAPAVTKLPPELDAVDDEAVENEMLDANTEPPPTGIPGFIIKSDDEVDIDPAAVPDWTIDQRAAVALALGKNLMALKLKPQLFNLEFFAFLKKQGLEITDEEDDTPKSKKAATPVEKREGAALPAMPGRQTLDKNKWPDPKKIEGDPSPVRGKRGPDDPKHVEFVDWKHSAAFIRMHAIAEDFRGYLAESKAAGSPTVAKNWECGGFNCHDCVEAYGNIDQIAECRAHFATQAKKKNLPFAYAFPHDAEKYTEDQDIPAKFINPKE
jgi:hypothetical protein